MDSLEYNSSKKLVCQSPKYVGVGTIVVSTFSGGPGTCNVHFTGLEQPKQPLLGKHHACIYVLLHLPVCKYKCIKGWRLPYILYLHPRLRSRWQSTVKMKFLCWSTVKINISQ